MIEHGVSLGRRFDGRFKVTPVGLAVTEEMPHVAGCTAEGVDRPATAVTVTGSPAATAFSKADPSTSPYV